MTTNATLMDLLAGLVGKIVEHPFDTIKVKLQSQPVTGAKMYNGPLNCLVKSVRQNGFWNLYQPADWQYGGKCGSVSYLWAGNEGTGQV
ncbi:hypothetical protein O9G_005589 [Rozella allomycis CSF55]|uniref:Mitochondrial carrier domain-containing protein n=1 Tax=Rozella allomycis (strain CSF55) TaxID=988480 RepID=A0A075B555_ROZAC|nr:hypothetical protein O9G_005589 [Rozella allomycis CSF55]|eukprot:EPZ36763.1 hypothetical protein O9G_005589 [Rozella allomycis CSF55]